MPDFHANADRSKYGKKRPERFTVDVLEPRDKADHLHVSVSLHRAPVVRVFFSDHHDAAQIDGSITNGAYGQQGMVDGTQTRARGNDHGSAHLKYEVQHER